MINWDKAKFLTKDDYSYSWHKAARFSTYEQAAKVAEELEGNYRILAVGKKCDKKTKRCVYISFPKRMTSEVCYIR